uniref:Uncharacterized protein n=1 Tax=Arundo donax TaxID=35708 RepID=A0A0A9A3A8_ARUDO
MQSCKYLRHIDDCIRIATFFPCSMVLFDILQYSRYDFIH